MSQRSTASTRKIKTAFLQLFLMVLCNCVVSVAEGCWQGRSRSIQPESPQMKKEEKTVAMDSSVGREKDRHEGGKKTRGDAMRELVAAEPSDMKTQRIHKQLTQIQKRMGSRPPLCTNKCNACNPCEAVQMPTPLVSNRGSGKIKPVSSTKRPFLHMDYANYEPEGWKCKCGSLIYNP